MSRGAVTGACRLQRSIVAGGRQDSTRRLGRAQKSSSEEAGGTERSGGGDPTLTEQEQRTQARQATAKFQGEGELQRLQQCRHACTAAQSREERMGQRWALVSSRPRMLLSKWQQAPP
jgi:hypothetical protein